MITIDTETKLLDFVLMSRNNLIGDDINRMFELMEQNYNCMDYDMFLYDLSKKNYVGVLYDHYRKIQGFTTFAINPKGTGTDNYGIIFSGDTIISPDYWGTMEMVRGWATSVGRIIASEPGKKWYWFLLSKGHRTYMYLPLFFNEYYPSANGSLANPLLEILETTAQRLYDGCYKQASGLIVFDRKMGELKSIHTQSTYEKQHKPHVKLFLRLNPNFHQGDELVCLTHLHPDNMRGYAKKYMLEGMAQNL